jgi:hypothetical protein
MAKGPMDAYFERTSGDDFLQGVDTNIRYDEAFLEAVRKAEGETDLTSVKTGGVYRVKFKRDVRAR